MNNRRWFKITFLFLGIAILIGIAMLNPSSSSSSDPSRQPPKVIRIATGMLVKDFIAINDLSIGSRIKHGFAINVDKINDNSPIIFEDHWISLEVRDGKQSFTLPPGRTLFISQLAGRITGFAFRPFIQPRPIDELHMYTVSLLQELEGKGWQPSGSIQVPEKIEDFNFSGESLFADLDSPSGNSLQMNMRDYGLAPKSESYILTFNPNAEPAKASHTYLLQVTVTDANTADYFFLNDHLVYPRRIFVSGKKREALPLRIWIDDPDWTPQQAGMVEIPPEERTKIDPLFWKMPPETTDDSSR